MLRDRHWEQGIKRKLPFSSSLKSSMNWIFSSCGPSVRKTTDALWAASGLQMASRPAVRKRGLHDGWYTWEVGQRRLQNLASSVTSTSCLKSATLSPPSGQRNTWHSPTSQSGYQVKPAEDIELSKQFKTSMTILPGSEKQCNTEYWKLIKCPGVLGAR